MTTFSIPFATSVCSRAFAAALVVAMLVAGAAARTPAQPVAGPSLVVILTRHGVRSPGSPTELAPYSVHQWPQWEVKNGYLTPHGVSLMRQFGQYYRRYYSSLGVLPVAGCPGAGSVYVWADVDERTKATGSALLEGLAPGCGIAVNHVSGTSDPLFDPLPALGKANTALSLASTLGALGNDPNALVDAYSSAYATLDKVLGCSTSCKRLSEVRTTIDPDPDTGLAAVDGGLDAAGTAAEDFLLEYADGKPEAGWGQVDGTTILHLMHLHALKSMIEHQTYYNARAEGSNILSAIAATLRQRTAGRKDSNTLAPLSSRLVFIVGHDTDLSLLAGVLRLSWLMKGYQLDDTPPGGALVFELYQPPGAAPYVKLFFTAQSLDQMRAGDGTHPARVPVFLPGCPSLECPAQTFFDVVARSIDLRFVAPWRQR